ncbi:PREDICTED: trypsin-2-like [Nicrophorus vespilloides]|uniref:Trypsin-2-like n=1 Tax=Nicrophorus vespilloides TaxID=110193 RepID=A0ABM1M4I5_NICVS|nr:PREDICTED: trypsin-2-like [Nicrophorus vespilloides]
MKRHHMVFVAIICFANGALGIVDGIEVRIEDASYQLSLEYYSSHLCGAAIIDKTFAITSAHCTEGINVNHLKVRAGSGSRDSGGVLVAVKAIYRHPNYNALTFQADVAVLELGTALEFGPTVNKIQLPLKNETPAWVGLLTGWGLDGLEGKLAKNLRQVEMTVLGRDECINAYGNSFLKSTMMCVQGEACQGDCGGPMVSNNFLIGVISLSFGCGNLGYPTVCTDISEVRDFIEDTTGL